MANDYFQFKKFRISQGRCAMKVGTDGTLLGAWSHGGATILDIGTGTGVIALMMAQRFPDAKVVGIDIEPEAVSQAQENVAASPFAANISIRCSDVRTLSGELYDVIVCNPPFFMDALTCPDERRTLARHTATLAYHELENAVVRLLADDGEFSVVIPFDCKAKFEEETFMAGLFKWRECAIKTTPRKQAKRFLLSFGKHPHDIEMEEGVIETSPGVRSLWYQELTKDFYL